MLQSWDSFFSAVLVVLRECAEDNIAHAPDHKTILYSLSRIENCVSGLRRVQYIDSISDQLASLRSVQQEDHPLSHLVSEVQLLFDFFCSQYAMWKQAEDQLSRNQPFASTIQSDVYARSSGRPTLFINRDQVEYLHSLSFSWTEIASLFGVSRMTLHRRR